MNDDWDAEFERQLLDEEELQADLTHARRLARQRAADIAECGVSDIPTQPDNNNPGDSHEL